MRKKREFSYDGDVGRWWLARSLDRSHRRAYLKIADFIRESFVREPRLIVDYACGSGDLLGRLGLRFRRSKLVGLDGSSFLLELARLRIESLPAECAGRISLVRTELPNPGILKDKADLVVFCFPNMIPFSGASGSLRDRECLSESDRKIAESLLLSADAEEGEHAKPQASEGWTALELGRCISWNLRQLLVDSGVCIRVEYATAQRHELSPTELSLVSFEEGSLDTLVEGRQPRLWFRLLASAYFRSRVLEDVFDQTGDERDKNGGYLITVLRAV